MVNICCFLTARTPNVYAVDHHKGNVGLSARSLYPDDFTEDILHLHEAEVSMLKKYYEDHQELFEGVMKWQENWTLYLELDVSTVFEYSVAAFKTDFSRCGYM